MSGPKDYRVQIAQRRLNEIRQRQQALLRERASQTQRRLAAEQASARRRVEAALSARQQSTEAELQRRREEAQDRLQEAQREAQRASQQQHVDQQAQKTAQKQAQFVAQVHDAVAQARAAFESVAAAIGDAAAAGGEVAELALELQAMETTAPSEKVVQQARSVALRAQALAGQVKQQAQQLQQTLEQISSWQKELGEEHTVQHFQRVQAEDWHARAGELLAQVQHGKNLQQSLTQAQGLARQAQAIYDEAGERQARAQTRNELLRDVIDSLKEIGFFVSDPFYQDASDPSGAVIVKATRGQEQMTAWLDLSDQVRSVWDNIEQEHCKTGFFEYVDSMARKGIEVIPDRADLQDRPKLIRKGAKDLPRSQRDQVGG